jgi:methylenetetrahydrofolate dehydrogenase (NADP+)/methenyltetrahydrofolate cyclohydrolase
MAATIIDGKAFAADMTRALAQRVADLKAKHGVVPGLTVILVGDDPASQVYVRNKERDAAQAGFKSALIRLPASASQSDVLGRIDGFNRDAEIDGILVQLPLPKQIDSRAVIDVLNPTKDVDGFHPLNVARLHQGGGGLVPCTPLGCLKLLRHYHGAMAGAEAVVVGRSNIVGRPMAALLLAEDCTVTIAHSKTRDLPAVCRRADILIAAVGKPEMIRGDWIKPGATVIDVGVNRVPKPDGKSRLVGDVAFAEAAEVAGRITPVPGGVGPMTIACLLDNTVTAMVRRRRLATDGASA